MILPATPSLLSIVQIVAQQATTTNNPYLGELDQLLPQNLTPPQFNNRVRTIHKSRTPIVANKVDLVRLHTLVNALNCFTVLEFGCGYSTTVLAAALQTNQAKSELHLLADASRHEHPFRVHSVDASRRFIRHTKRLLRSNNLNNASVSYSACRTSQFARTGGVCSQFVKIPNITPDLIYIDAPALHQVRGSVNGLSFNNHSRSPVSSDLVIMEPLLRPGTVVVLDGQTATVRALLQNLSRNWGYAYCSKTDGHYLELLELPLGDVHAQVLSMQRGKMWVSEVEALT